MPVFHLVSRPRGEAIRRNSRASPTVFKCHSSGRIRAFDQSSNETLEALIPEDMRDPSIQNGWEVSK